MRRSHGPPATATPTRSSRGPCTAPRSPGAPCGASSGLTPDEVVDLLGRTSVRLGVDARLLDVVRQQRLSSSAGEPVAVGLEVVQLALAGRHGGVLVGGHDCAAEKMAASCSKSGSTWTTRL